MRTVIIRCREDGSSNIKRQKDPNLRAVELLKRLPNIKSLCIDWEDQSSAFLPDYLSHTNHPQLREITFLGWNTSLGEMCDCIGATSLSSIVANAIDPSSRVSSHHIEQNSAGRDGPNLSLMKLGRTHLPHPQLHKLLELASSVTTLQCATPGLQETTGSFPNRRIRSTMESILSPALTAQTLAPLQASLVQLTLSDGSTTYWPGHDGTQLDLSKFTSLKILSITSNLHFKDMPQIHRKSVRGLLPLSLEELKARSISPHVLRSGFHANRSPYQVLALVPFRKPLPLQRRGASPMVSRRELQP